MSNTPLDMKAGNVYKTRSNGYLEVLKYTNCTNVKVRFLDTGYIAIATTSRIRSGAIKDKMRPSVFGVGYVGGDSFSCTRDPLIYGAWQGVLQRCYDEKFKSRYPTYKDCTVCDEWHNFQVFAEWMSSQDYIGKQIDKDIKVKGNKHYSPETCTFVSQKENIVAAIARPHFFVSPDGDVVEIFNLTEFCRGTNLTRETMSKVHRGIVKNHKGWTKHNCTKKGEA